MYERNPLCGIDYPCGDYQDFSNTCQALTNEDLGSGSGMFGVNISDEVTNQTVMDMSSSSPRLPSGLRICNQPNTALWSTILCLGTFVIAVLLRKLRQGKFLGKKVCVCVCVRECATSGWSIGVGCTSINYGR